MAATHHTAMANATRGGVMKLGHGLRMASWYMEIPTGIEQTAPTIAVQIPVLGIIAERMTSTKTMMRRAANSRWKPIGV